MKMKYFILMLTGLGISITSFAQKGEVNTAKTSYQKYVSLKGAPGAEKLAEVEIKKAKESADKATVNEKTKADPLIWTYKALIYADLALVDSVESRTAPIFAEALSSYNTALSLDKEGANKELLKSVPEMLSQYQFNKGVRAYNVKDFGKAYTEFKGGLKYLPADSTLTLYSGLMAVYAKDYKSAIEQYNALVTNKTTNPEIYTMLAELYFDQKDTVNAIRVASEGAVKYPTSTGLVSKEIEYSLMSGKNKEVIEKINDQIKKDPTNKYNPYYLGIAYTGTEDYAKAEEAYKAAIALDPKFADAYMNAGGVILDGGISAYNAASKIPANEAARYKEAEQKALAEVERALPYIEKAVELNPKSRIALSHLKLYYTVKRDAAKMKEVQEKIDALP